MASCFLSFSVEELGKLMMVYSDTSIRDTFGEDHLALEVVLQATVFVEAWEVEDIYFEVVMLMVVSQAMEE